MKYSKSSLLCFICAARSLTTGVSQSNIKDVVSDGGANHVSFSISYTNDDGTDCEPCTFCEGSSATDFFDPKSPSICITCGTEGKICNKLALTTSFKTPWAMEYTSLTSHDGGEELHDPKTILVQASNDYDAASKKGTWETLLTSSSALVFQERYVPQDIMLDNDDEYHHYRIVLQIKDGSTIMKVGHYGLIQAYLKLYTVELVEKITDLKVKGLPTRAPTATPSASPTTAMPTMSPSTEPMEVTWVMGGGGATCDATCTPLGLRCSSEEQTQIDTPEKVVETFKEAGFTCTGSGADLKRAYPGAPFRNGGRCYYFGAADYQTNLEKSSCTLNYYGHHYALCACV